MKKINPRIYEILSEFEGRNEEGIVYLLAKHYNLTSKTSFFPDGLIARMNRTGIFYMDDNNSLQWKIPLFDGEEESVWDWVKKEYWQMFKDLNHNKQGNGNQCIRLMKRLFIENPDIRKDEIMGATTLYIQSLNDYTYARQANYFISKGIGANRTQDILTWVETYREKFTNSEVEDMTSTMQ